MTMAALGVTACFVAAAWALLNIAHGMLFFPTLRLRGLRYRAHASWRRSSSWRARFIQDKFTEGSVWRFWLGPVFLHVMVDNARR